jgi:hypothetical protein
MPRNSPEGDASRAAPIPLMTAMISAAAASGRRAVSGGDGRSLRAGAGAIEPVERLGQRDAGVRPRVEARACREPFRPVGRVAPAPVVGRGGDDPGGRAAVVAGLEVVEGARDIRGSTTRPPSRGDRPRSPHRGPHGGSRSRRYGRWRRRGSAAWRSRSPRAPGPEARSAAWRSAETADRRRAEEVEREAHEMGAEIHQRAAARLAEVAEPRLVRPVGVVEDEVGREEAADAARVEHLRMARTRRSAGSRGRRQGAGRGPRLRDDARRLRPPSAERLLAEHGRARASAASACPAWSAEGSRSRPRRGEREEIVEARVRTASGTAAAAAASASGEGS